MKDATPAEIFAALKLIEQLYQDGRIIAPLSIEYHKKNKNVKRNSRTSIEC